MWAAPRRRSASPHGGGEPLVRHEAGAAVDTSCLTWAPRTREGASPLLGSGPMGNGIGTKQEGGRGHHFVRAPPENRALRRVWEALMGRQ